MQNTKIFQRAFALVLNKIDVNSNAHIINPLVPSAHKTARMAKISILKLGGIIKKFPMSVAIMSQWTKRAYLRLFPEKPRKKNSGSKGFNILNNNIRKKIYLSWQVIYVKIVT